MRSMLFYAYVDAIEKAIEHSLPELRKKFGKSIKLQEVIDTIGTTPLMHASYNSSGQVIPVIRLYEETIDKQNPKFLGEGI